MNKIVIDFFYKSDGSEAAPSIKYEYDPSSQQDMIATAMSAANALVKIEKIGTENKVALEVKCNMKPEFHPYLMAAVDAVRTADWNVSDMRISGRGPAGGAPSANQAIGMLDD